MKITSNLTHNRQKRQKAQNKKTSFLKELVENADLHKPVLNKIKTTKKYCEKYNFVAPLNNHTVSFFYYFNFLMH